MGNLIEALLLMVVGMSTVFIVLCLVIVTGNILINAVNKYCPEQTSAKTVTTLNNTVDSKVANIIENAIATITNGKGKVEKIEKL